MHYLFSQSKCVYSIRAWIYHLLFAPSLFHCEGWTHYRILSYTQWFLIIMAMKPHYNQTNQLFFFSFNNTIIMSVCCHFRAMMMETVWKWLHLLQLWHSHQSSTLRAGLQNVQWCSTVFSLARLLMWCTRVFRMVKPCFMMWSIRWTMRDTSKCERHL